MSLGNNIKRFRKDLGITQEELANVLCVTSQAVSKWESGAGLPDITIVRQAENRAMQVIRYADNKMLSDECHYALAWLCWHTQDWDKGRQHIEALPSIGNNMLQETLLPYYINIDTEEGKKNWQARIRDNYQNYIRAINKQIVYTAEAMMWVSPLAETEANCRWGIAIMDEFMKNDKMKAHCQGFYRETYKYLIGAYLRNNEPKKAADEWRILNAKIDEYVDFCKDINAKSYDERVCMFGKKSADNMASYTKEWIDGKIEFMLGQIESMSSREAYEEFKKLI